MSQLFVELIPYSQYLLCSILIVCSLVQHIIIISHESLHHTGSYSRHYTCPKIGKRLTQEGMCFFTYVWKYDTKKPKVKSKGTHDNLTREYGAFVYREDITIMHAPIFIMSIQCVEKVNAKNSNLIYVQ